MDTAAPTARADFAAAPAPTVAVRVWDLPTRLFHWVLAACVLGSVVSAKVGGNAMAWHFRLGYAVLALLAFRLAWGFVGGRWSRFGAFVRGPAAVWRYLRGRAAPDDDIGHSPLGGLSVLALLGWLALQVATGLVADDEIAWIGPLNRFVASATAASATSWHKTGGQWGVIALVVLHVAAIAVYLFRGRNLVAPMIDGDKPLPAGTPASRDGAAQRLLALALLVACAGAVAWLVLGIAA